METNSKEVVTFKNLPNLHESQVSERELSSTYWSPENEGEYKVGVVIDLTEEDYVNESTSEVVKLPSIIMLSQEIDGSFNTIRNSSKRLVATLEKAINDGEVVLQKTPVRITFKGKEKNKTNSYMSDRWSVKPINL